MKRKNPAVSTRSRTPKNDSPGKPTKAMVPPAAVKPKARKISLAGYDLTIVEKPVKSTVPENKAGRSPRKKLKS
jgi:hypothetical protein